jgi:hypothetical protein
VKVASSRLYPMLEPSSIMSVAMTDRDESYEVTCAATIPLPGILGVIVSYPLAVLEVNPHGLCVRLRWARFSALVRWFMSRMGAPEGSPAEWRASWAAIDRVIVGPRSVVVFRGSGYPCRFATWKRAEVSRVVDDLVAHQVTVERSQTTVRYAYYATQPSANRSKSGPGRRYLRLVAFAPMLVGVGGIVLVTQGGRWTLVGFVIAGFGAIASMVGLVGLSRRGS